MGSDHNSDKDGAHEKIPDLLILRQERLVDNELFEESPVRAITRFLQCFDSEFRQKYGVPQYVLEALAVRFGAVMSKEVNSLDEAFGGRIARQRNTLLQKEDDWDVVFDMIEETRDLKQKKRQHKTNGSKRRNPGDGVVGTPFENATEKVGNAYKISDQTVRKIYKKAGRRPKT